MVLDHNINDIIAYNHRGEFSVGIIVRITIIGSGVLYGLNNGAEILEENIIQFLGNAASIKAEYESQSGSDPEDL